MKKLLIFILFFSFSANAEWIEVSEKHKHLGNFSANESCKIAIEKAQKKALRETLGIEISSDVVSKCSEVDGEYDCERNQLSLFQLNGNIVGLNVIEKDDGKDENGIRFCEVTLKANVVPIKQNNDPSFFFDVKLNQEIFRTDDVVKIEINTSKKMYMTIFQWLPYGGTKYNVITKIFPNKDFNKKITDDLVDGKLELAYKVYFPEEIRKNKVDEYFIFVASEKPVKWLDEYTQIEGLKKQFSKTNILMEKHYSGYMLIK